MTKGDLKPKKIKPRMTVLRALKYKDSMVYLRKFNEDLFTYDLIYKDELYSSYMVFTPRNGQKKLSKKEQTNAASLLWAGAVSTIEALLEKEKLKKGEKIEKKKVSKAVESIANLPN